MCSAKDQEKRMKRQSTVLDKIFANHIHDKGLGTHKTQWKQIIRLEIRHKT